MSKVLEYSPTKTIEQQLREERFRDEVLDHNITVSMGPQHPSTHGVLRLEIELDGETVVKTIPDIGYLHTGMEKIMEYKKYQQNIVITDRMDYLNPMGNNLGYIMCVEKLLGITDEIPERAKVIRVMLTELQRIASHMVWLGTHALDIGAMSVFFYCFREREKILNIYEAICGGRMTVSFFRVGGLPYDIPEFVPKMVRDFCDGFPSAVDEYETLLAGNKIFQSRTRGVGVISAEDAIQWALTGPSLRGSGIDFDVRRYDPYCGYETYDFDVPTELDGDVWARFRVRMRELRESLKIVRQAVDRLKPGSVKVDSPKIALPEREIMKSQMDALIHHFLLAGLGFEVPPGEAYHAIEGSKGELGFYIVSDGSERPYRVHVRGPSFVNLQALPSMAQGYLIADVVAIIGSLDIVLGEIDR
ncbi:MAG: NADH-quinone oxidoreductase subunit D [Blastocatellia bacterium]|nr:NADH-quinone oxidoreductase subunit D [Blastocatellia bacterium]